jgi:hypothetical protein
MTDYRGHVSDGTRDPFKIEGPALISFSGGRSSGYMLWRILQAHGGTLPDDVLVTFANTGKEMPQTLDFVRDCGERWGVEIVWLEYQHGGFRRVDYLSASRHGEPFSALTDRRSFLPNPVARFCTQELKIKTMEAFARSLGWDDYTNVIGLRADEPMRIMKMRGLHAVPLAAARITKADVLRFWHHHPFDLKILRGQGNCDLCFLKGAATIQGVMRDVPGVSAWWIEQERLHSATFRSDRPSYGEMFKAVQEQRNFDFGDRDELVDCFCGEAT